MHILMFNQVSLLTKSFGTEVTFSPSSMCTLMFNVYLIFHFNKKILTKFTFKIFFSDCVYWCLSNFPFEVNLFSQNLHLYSFTLEYIFFATVICHTYCVPPPTVFLHILHATHCVCHACGGTLCVVCNMCGN